MAVQAQYLSNMRNRHLFASENKVSIPIAFFRPENYMDHQIQQQQQQQIQSQSQNQSPPVNGLPNQLPYMTQCTCLHGSENDLAWNLLAPRQRAREHELLENSQISSIDFLQSQRTTQIALPQYNGAISTGLRLSLDDEKLNSSGNMSLSTSKVSLMNEELSGVLQQQNAEIDQFLRAQIREVRPKVTLVARMEASVANYDYIVDWEFQTDGFIRIKVGLNGILMIKGTKYENVNQIKSEDEIHGTLLAHNTIGVIHDHYVTFYLDMDVDGTDNSFVQVKMAKQTVKNGKTPRNFFWKAERHIAKTEKDAQIKLRI